MLKGFTVVNTISFEFLLERMDPIFTGNVDFKREFGFHFYDNDGDGHVKSVDLEQILDKILPCPKQGEVLACSCPLYKETQRLIAEYIRYNIFSQKKFPVDFDFYKQQFDYGCMYHEIMDRLLGKPEETSIFVAYPEHSNVQRRLPKMTDSDMTPSKTNTQVLSPTSKAHNLKRTHNSLQSVVSSKFSFA